VALFYDSKTSPDARAEILRQYGVTLVYESPWERALGDWDPSQMPGLTPVYVAEHYRVFQVEGRPDIVKE
jgi:uncharacterized membrane protein